MVVPITPKQDWEAVKLFAKKVAEDLVREAPQRYTATMSKSKREGKIYIDYYVTPGRRQRSALFPRVPEPTRRYPFPCIGMSWRRMFGENILRFTMCPNGWRACEQTHGRAMKRRDALSPIS